MLNHINLQWVWKWEFQFSCYTRDGCWGEEEDAEHASEDYTICSIRYIFRSVCMHMLTNILAIKPHVGLVFVCVIICFVLFLRKMQQADEDDHAPPATINFIQEDGEVVLSHYLKTQHELLKKKYSSVKQASKVISTLTLFYQPVYNTHWYEGLCTYSDLRFK